MTPSSDSGLPKLFELIKGIEVAMLTTEDAEGKLRSRPMMTQEVGDDGVLWFFSGNHDGKAQEIAKHHTVNLSYAQPNKHRYVSVSGTAEVVEDRAKAKALWKPIYKAWFPDGPEDPKLALLRINIETAEYWDSPSSPVVYLVGVTKALLTGQSYKGGEDSHGRISNTDSYV